MSAVPTTFGKYFLSEKLATGGMAEIYLGKLIGPGGFEKQLIIKQIHPRYGDRREFVDLFVAEAKTLVSLSHGNIVPVYELGVVDGTYFLAMEYIDGPTLAELGAALRAQGRPIAPPLAAYMVAELLRGLDYAHRKGAGVIHRDLSPRNVMLSRDGEIKLVDFGLAAAVDEERPDEPTPPKTRPAGSYPYMSPEQVRREPLDARTDLFSAGILLWEALTGQALFARDGDDETLAAVLEAPIVPVSDLRDDIPPMLDVVCRRALARERGKRFATAAEFLAALTRYLYTVDPPVTSADVAALVAEMCPARPRRRISSRPSGNGSSGHGSGGSDRSGSDGSDGDSARTSVAARPGGETRPMSTRRSDAAAAAAVVAAVAAPDGPGRSFATSVQFEEVLRNATPLLPFAALAEAIDAADPAPRGAVPTAVAGDTPTVRARRQKAGDAASGVEPAVGGVRGAADRAADAGAGAGVAAASTSVVPPGGRGRLLAIIVLLGAAGVVATVLIDQRGGRRGGIAARSRPDAAPLALPPPALDAGVDRVAPGPPDAAPAPPPRPIDAGVTVIHRKRPDAGPVAPAARGQLKVIANPWADVYVDGKHVGRASGTFTVKAGKHTVELRFDPTPDAPGDERSVTRTVTVEADQLATIPRVDFSGP